MEPAAPSPKHAPSVRAAAANVEAPAPTPIEAEPLEFRGERPWRGFGFSRCTYAAPRGAFTTKDGAVDVVVHFHAGQMSERDMKESGLRAVFVSCSYGIGSTGYARAFADPARFDTLMTRLLGAVAKDAHLPPLRLRRLALVSWSAGFAAVSRILRAPRWYDATDTVVLLDSLHARYDAEHEVDASSLQRFVRFATDAKDGKKTMVLTHSSVTPPGYASTRETAAALLGEVGVVATAVTDAEPPFPVAANTAAPARTRRPMELATTADQGGLHVRGFRGAGPRDHFDHLHLLDDTLRSWVVPRWYTPAQ